MLEEACKCRSLKAQDADQSVKTVPVCMLLSAYFDPVRMLLSAYFDLGLINYSRYGSDSLWHCGNMSIGQSFSL